MSVNTGTGSVFLHRFMASFLLQEVLLSHRLESPEGVVLFLDRRIESIRIFKREKSVLSKKMASKSVS